MTKETSEEKKHSIVNEIKSDLSISKIRKNPWMLASIILGIAFIVLLLLNFTSIINMSKDSAGEKLVTYLNGKTGGGVTLVSAEEESGVYKIIVDYQNESIPVYTTKDGKFFIQMMIPLEETTEEQPVQETKEVPKSDKPKAELFIMTHCPYGTQAEKGLIPVIKALGNKADVSIRFVHYFMHGEKEENETYAQLCIREEQNAKFLSYLECFLEDGNSARCLTKTGIDSNKLKTCLNNGKAKEYYAVDSKLSNEYGVQGSPTLIVNGVEASSGRSSSALLGTICSAFNTNPSECSKTLSTETPSAGFGYGASGTANSAQC